MSLTTLAQLAVPRKDIKMVSGPDATTTFVSTDGSRNTCVEKGGQYFRMALLCKASGMTTTPLRE